MRIFNLIESQRASDIVGERAVYSATNLNSSNVSDLWWSGFSMASNLIVNRRGRFQLKPNLLKAFSTVRTFCGSDRRCQAMRATFFQDKFFYDCIVDSKILLPI